MRRFFCEKKDAPLDVTGRVDVTSTDEDVTSTVQDGRVLYLPDATPLSEVRLPRTTPERIRNNLKGFKGFYLKDKARIWP